LGGGGGGGGWREGCKRGMGVENKKKNFKKKKKKNFEKKRLIERTYLDCQLTGLFSHFDKSLRGNDWYEYSGGEMEGKFWVENRNFNSFFCFFCYFF